MTAATTAAAAPTADAATDSDDTLHETSAQADARAELSTLNQPKELAAWLTRERLTLQERWSSERGGRAWMHEHASLLDAVIRRLFALAQEQAGAENGNGANGHHHGTAGIAILAVGGYGQRLMAPHSDLDLTFLSERNDDPPVLRYMFRLVMDVLLSGAKLKVGYAYRTLAEVTGDTLDHQTQTALLDARLITGDGGLFHRFQDMFPAHLAVADFLFRKEAERERIRARHGGSAFVTEPNVKEGVGGVRDLQTAYWMARVRFGKSGENLWRDLVRRKVLTREDWESLAAARELLLTVRCGLHVLSGERRDILTMTRQEEIAERLGFAAVDADGTPGVERFMHGYYNAAFQVQRLADKVMSRCLDAPLPLGHDTGLSSVRRLVSITDPARVEADPLWPLTALEACQEHNLELATPTDETIERHLADGAWGGPGSELRRAAGSRFVDLLGRSGDAGATLRRMRRTTMLRALLPELDDTMGLIPYDPSHTRTVGEHSLGVLDHLIRLRDDVEDGDPLLGGYRNVLDSLLSPVPLYLAALLHDVGKQWPTLRSGERAGHEITGAERVADICERLGCSEAVTEQTVFLVREHLLLARVSRLRDLALPATIAEVMRAVGDRERLRMLYLLTWADTGAVGPGVLTGMNARLLDELFARTDEAFESGGAPPQALRSGEGESPRMDGFRQRLQRQVVKVGPTVGGATAALPEEAHSHIAVMPTAYLLNTPPETMALHLELVSRLRDENGVVVDMRSAQVGGGAQASETAMTVVTHDAPGLFAKITGALYACDVRLHSVQAFTRPASEGDVGPDIVIDTLAVDYRDRPLGPERRRITEDALRQVLTGAETVEALVTRKRGGAAWAEPLKARAAQVDNTTAAPGFTLVDIEAPDELGITYRLASSFAGLGWNIHAARLSTWGGNARCAFYLTDGAGHALDAEAVRTGLREVLGLSASLVRLV